MRLSVFLIACVSTAALLLMTGVSRGESAEPIGLFTTTIGHVQVTHVETQAPVRVKVRDDVLFQDRVETERRSRAKILFIDDSTLTIGEQSRIEITEHVFDSKKARPPSTILKLLDGTVKAVVGKVYGQEGAKFEIHTPTAVAAARGTNFIVNIAKDLPGKPTTILVLEGTVQVQDVKAVGVVTVSHGQFTLVQPGVRPTPSAPAPKEMVARLTAETRVEQTQESAKQEANEPAAGAKEESKDAKKGPAEAVPEDTATEAATPSIGEAVASPVTPSELPGLPPIPQQPAPLTPVGVKVEF